MTERLQAPAGFHDATPDQQRQLILSLVLRGKVPLSEFLDTVTELATGPSSFICNECVEFCHELCTEDEGATE
jgi:hypothetical protein